MAVQAQYPSNILLLNRNEEESKNMMTLGTNNYSLQPHQLRGEVFLDQSHMFFNNHNNGGGVNPRKRSREVAINSINFSLQSHENQNHQFIRLSQLQNHQPKNQNVVSTGLKLSFGEQNQQHSTNFSEELTFQLKQQSDELNYFLNAQGEQLRRTLADKSQIHYRVLLDTAQEAVARRVQEKEAEVETAARQNAELLARVAQISTEVQHLQAKAQAQEAQVVSLQAQLQQVMERPNTVDGPLQQDRNESGGAQEDAESVYVDLVSERRVDSQNCKVCRTHIASVVLLPCRHLCLCVKCDGHVKACPVCCSLRSASVEVYFT